ncbi:MAG: cytochrome oxidase small assembly protein [Roseateles sp.]
MTPEQRKNNRRLGLILLTIALAFGVGFVAKIVLLAG